MMTAGLDWIQACTPGFLRSLAKMEKRNVGLPMGIPRGIAPRYQSAHKPDIDDVIRCQPWEG